MKFEIKDEGKKEVVAFLATMKGGGMVAPRLFINSWEGRPICVTQCRYSPSVGSFTTLFQLYIENENWDVTPIYEGQEVTIKF